MFHISVYIPVCACMSAGEQVTEDRSELLFRFEDKGRKLDPTESLYNGRILSLQDILGASIETRHPTPTSSATPTPTSTPPTSTPPPSPIANSSSSTTSTIAVTNGISIQAATEGRTFIFKLATREEDLLFEFVSLNVDEGQAWLDALHDAVSFVHVPKPSSRSMSAMALGGRGGAGGEGQGSLASTALGARSYSTSSASASVSASPTGKAAASSTTASPAPSNAIDFSVNSGAVFALAGDVSVLLQEMQEFNAIKVPVLPELCDAFQAVLILISEVRCFTIFSPFVFDSPNDIHNMTVYLSISLNHVHSLHSQTQKRPSPLH